VTRAYRSKFSWGKPRAGGEKGEEEARRKVARDGTAQKYLSRDISTCARQLMRINDSPVAAGHTLDL